MKGVTSINRKAVEQMSFKDFEKVLKPRMPKADLKALYKANGGKDSVKESQKDI